MSPSPQGSGAQDDVTSVGQCVFVDLDATQVNKNILSIAFVYVVVASLNFVKLINHLLIK